MGMHQPYNNGQRKNEEDTGQIENNQYTQRQRTLNVQILGKEPLFLKHIVGQEKAKEQIKKTIKTLVNRDLSQLYGIKPENILLYGPAGTGKTLTAKVLAHELFYTDVIVFSLNLQDIGTCYVNETAKNFSSYIEGVKTFVKNNEDKNYAVIFIDEFDSVASSREGFNRSGEDNKLVNAINSVLDGDRSSDKITYIAATNFYDNIDKAQKSRFGTHIPYEPFTNKKDISDLFKVHIEKIKEKQPPGMSIDLMENINYDLLAYRLKDMTITGRDVKIMVNRGLQDKFFSLYEVGLKDMNRSKLVVKTKDFYNAIDSFKDERKGKPKIGFN